MIIARWQIDARFGHKSKVLDSMRKWYEEIGNQVGWSPEKVRIMTGSVGARESTIITEVELDSMTELDKAWNKLATIDAHAQWSKDLEPMIVSGSHRWEVYRVI